MQLFKSQNQQMDKVRFLFNREKKTDETNEGFHIVLLKSETDPHPC